MKITHYPPGYAIGYDNSASVMGGFFVSRFGGAGSHRYHGKTTVKISQDHAMKLGSAVSLSDAISVNKGKSDK